MVKTKSRRSRLSKKRWAILVLAVILVAGLAYWKLGANKDEPAASTGQNPKTSKNYVNLNPPTSQEKSQADARKDDIVKNSNPPPTPPPTASGKKPVTPIITNANQSTINSYISGVFEDGGTCTATITNTATSQVVTKTSEGFKNVSYTSCAPMNISLGSGKWSVVVSYSSATSEGKSAATAVEVK